MQQSVGCLMTLGAIIRGSESNQLKPFLQDVVNIMGDGNISKIADVSLNHHHYYNAPNNKPVLPSAAQTRNSKGLKIYPCMVLTLAGDQKVF